MRRGRSIAGGVVLAALLATAGAGAGGLTFEDSVAYPAGDGDTFRITKGDFNGDDRVDLAATNLETPFFTVSVFLGKGQQGKFEDGVPFIGGGTDADIESGRFGSDPNVDLAVTDDDNGTVEVFSGNGDGTFEFEDFDSYDAGAAVFGIDTAKLDNDRWTDIVTANSIGGISVLLGKKNGSFEEAEDLEMGNNDDDVIITDLNGDGEPDVATSDCDDQMVVRIGRPDGSLKAPKLYDAGECPGAIAAGDLNGDGRKDIVVANRISSDLAIFLRGSGNSYQDAIFQDVNNADLGLVRIAVADFDGDRKLDVALPGQQTGGVLLMRGRGNGRVRAPLSFGTAGGGSGVVAGNLKPGDGPDIASTSFGADSISVLLNR